MRSFHEPLNFFMKNCFYSYEFFSSFNRFSKSGFLSFFFLAFCSISSGFYPLRSLRQKDLSLIPRLVSLSFFRKKGKKKHSPNPKQISRHWLQKMFQREKNIRQHTTNGSIKQTHSNVEKRKNVEERKLKKNFADDLNRFF